MTYNTQPVDSTMDFFFMRKHMVEYQLSNRDIADSHVLAAMESVPRHLFVRDQDLRYAYEDTPLKLGEGQTISQPYIVAYMSQSIDIKEDNRILEIGGGCGYQAAVLGYLCREVVSVEVDPELAERARENLARAHVSNVKVVIGNGKEGYEAGAPYDAVIVSCATPQLFPKWKEQTVVGGTLVAPMVEAEGKQHLWKFHRNSRGWDAGVRLCGVTFVPLVF